MIIFFIEWRNNILIKKTYVRISYLFRENFLSKYVFIFTCNMGVYLNWFSLPYLSDTLGFTFYFFNIRILNYWLFNTNYFYNTLIYLFCCYFFFFGIVFVFIFINIWWLLTNLIFILQLIYIYLCLAFNNIMNKIFKIFIEDGRYENFSIIFNYYISFLIINYYFILNALLRRTHRWFYIINIKLLLYLWTLISTLCLFSINFILETIGKTLVWLFFNVQEDFFLYLLWLGFIKINRSNTIRLFNHCNNLISIWRELLIWKFFNMNFLCLNFIVCFIF